jgi:hypothetical protein
LGRVPRLLESFYCQRILLERRLDVPIPEVVTGVPSRLAILGGEDLAAYLAFRPTSRATIVERRWAMGHRCFVAWVDGRIASASWAAVERCRVEELRLELRIPAGQVYAYGSSTVPALRSRHLSRAVSVGMQRHFRAAGCWRIFSLVAPDNEAVIRSRAAVGYRPGGSISSIGAGPLRWHVRRVWPGSLERPA